MFDGWDDRFRAALKAHLDETGEAMHTLSYRAGCGRNYVHQILARGMPSVDKFIRLCEAINKNPVEIMLGRNLPDERTLRIANDFLALSEEEQSALKLFMSIAIAAREKVGD